MERVSVGRIVHYVLPDGQYPGEHRPAIVVKDWGGFNGCVQLVVFVDGNNDYPQSPQLPRGSELPVIPCSWRTSVVYSEEPKLNTWHWPERDGE